ncbi:MAG: hypothetical protein LBU32_14715 [Clostridiales bacterium]|jgi:hypothetical protein|nr:hypothetical protein [Clostridiales bacterium]
MLQTPTKNDEFKQGNTQPRRRHGAGRSVWHRSLGSNCGNPVEPSEIATTAVTPAVGTRLSPSQIHIIGLFQSINTWDILCYNAIARIIKHEWQICRKKNAKYSLKYAKFKFRAVLSRIFQIKNPHKATISPAGNLY